MRQWAERTEATVPTINESFAEISLRARRRAYQRLIADMTTTCDGVARGECCRLGCRDEPRGVPPYTEGEPQPARLQVEEP